MDKRYKPLTPLEQLEVRRQLLQDLADNPGLPVPDVVRRIRKALRLTIDDYARLCGISARGLQDIERRKASPTLATVEKLLKPMALTIAVVNAASVNEKRSAP
jgi:DNA-binding transcriptional regulator YiaG